MGTPREHDPEILSNRLLTYPGVESRFGVPAAKRLHIQMMSEKWGSGNPNANITDLTNAFYDDHHYVKWTPGVTVSRDRYMRHSCTDSSSGNWPVITGEWSLSVADSAEWNSEFTLDRADAVEWYRKWWTVQFLGYEKIDGWVYWTWKVNWIARRNDWRWGYKQGVEAGVISKKSSECLRGIYLDLFNIMTEGEEQQINIEFHKQLRLPYSESPGGRISAFNFQL